MECKISQGVTTVVTGNCGISLAPLSIERYPPPPLDIIGREAEAVLSDLRCLPVGARPRAAGAERRLPGRPFDACGSARWIVSTARPRKPRSQRCGARSNSRWSKARSACRPDCTIRRRRMRRPTKSIALSKAVHAYGGIHTTHMRDEASHLLRSVNETHLDRHGRGRSGRHLAPQGDRHSEPRHGEGFAGADRGGARKRQKLGLDAYPYVAVLDHAGPAPHFACEQDHRHLVEEPPGVRRPDARRDRQEAQDHRSRMRPRSCCPPARSTS